jgi:hypothetical protein
MALRGAGACLDGSSQCSWFALSGNNLLWSVLLFGIASPLIAAAGRTQEAGQEWHPRPFANMKRPGSRCKAKAGNRSPTLRVGFC